MASARSIIRFTVYTGLGMAMAAIIFARFEAHKAKALAIPARARRNNNPLPIRTALVSQQLAKVPVGAPGLTAANRSVLLKVGSNQLTQHDPLVKEVHVQNGDYVEAGEIVISLDPEPFENNAAEKQAVFAATQASLTHAQAVVEQGALTRQVELTAAASELDFRKTDVEFRLGDFDRLKKLFDDGNAAFTEFLEAASAKAEAQYRYTLALGRDQAAKSEMVLGPLKDFSDMELAEAAVKRAASELALAEQALGRCSLSSPMAGFVDSLIVSAGQSVNVGQNLIEVLAVDPIHVIVDFPQERIGDVTAGQLADVVLDSFPKETFKGKVVRVEAAIEVEGRVLPVVVEIPNADHRIKVGVSGYVRIDVSRQANVVPAVAVIGIDKRAMAFVVRDGHAKLVATSVGAVTETGFREVTDGLTAGDEVVVYGQQYLNDGEAVNANWRQWTRRE